MNLEVPVWAKIRNSTGSASRFGRYINKLFLDFKAVSDPGVFMHSFFLLTIGSTDDLTPGSKAPSVVARAAVANAGV